ncbi:hypothetical protein D9V86_00520 [Bacteroidetes/Chlorobi group bacterium ChocPot_Mid]|jgi:hypothetical protein|nr:MAG: hypothetical protein D9V86_00520 [Bacteroidetes/Chlorobi group bacterium ChocPot_Mid]
MHSGYKILTIALMICCFGSYAIAQIKGIEPPEEKKDTIFTYVSPRPLIANLEEEGTTKTAWGMDLVFSGNGFGLGMFYQRKFLKDWCVFSNLYISGARNTDEMEFYDYRNQMYFIPGKVNRLYIIPLTVGIQRYLFSEILHNNLQPFVNLGVGESLIIAAPYLNYENSFFKAMGKADLYGRFAGFIGIGANVGAESKAFMSINMRYYYIPFGRYGLESVKDSPIKDFGGLFLSLSLGTAF